MLIAVGADEQLSIVKEVLTALSQEMRTKQIESQQVERLQREKANLDKAYLELKQAYDQLLKSQAEEAGKKAKF